MDIIPINVVPIKSNHPGFLRFEIKYGSIKLLKIKIGVAHYKYLTHIHEENFKSFIRHYICEKMAIEIIPEKL